MTSRTLLFFVVILFSGNSLAALPAGVITRPGTLAPALVLKDADKGDFDLAKEKGRWVMVHFWASWCRPCQREIPTIQKMIRQIDRSKLKLVMINTAETEDEVFIFLTSHATELDSYLDRNGSITERWQPRGLPSSFFVDPEGKIRFLALGGRPWDQKEYLDFLKGLYAH